MNTSILTNTLQQFLLMRQAIAEADRRASTIGTVGNAHCRAARLLLASAESLDEAAEWQLGVIALLRQAIVFAAQGLALRRQAIDTDADLKAVWQSVSGFDDVEPTLRKLSVEARERVDALVESGLPAEDANLSIAEQRSLKQSLLLVVRCVLANLEGDVLAQKRLRATRLVRWVGLAIALVLLVTVAAKSFRPVRAKGNPNHVNLALGKKVTASSNWRLDVYPPDRLVDGDATQLGCHTEGQLEPWVMIDLDSVYTISEVTVTNRLGGITERAIPLRIDVSTDGKAFSEFARQTADFNTWTAKGTPAGARYVRLTVIGSTILHLNEVEVY